MHGGQPLPQPATDEYDPRLHVLDYIAAHSQKVLYKGSLVLHRSDLDLEILVARFVFSGVQNQSDSGLNAVIMHPGHDCWRPLSLPGTAECSFASPDDERFPPGFRIRTSVVGCTRTDASHPLRTDRGRRQC